MTAFPLSLEWALKENQKFGKKGAGKRMTKQIRTLLEGFFMAGNVSKSDRYTAQDMHQELVKCAKEGEIESDEIPKITTIQNWIAKTTREHQKQSAEMAIKTTNIQTSF